jgi:hypothetical protein
VAVLAQHGIGLQTHKGVAGAHPLRQILPQRELLQMLLQMGRGLGVNALNFSQGRVGSTVAGGGSERGQYGHVLIVHLLRDKPPDLASFHREFQPFSGSVAQQARRRIANSRG